MKKLLNLLIAMCTFFLLAGTALAIDAPAQRMFTPDEAIIQLKAGNDRFSTGHAIHPNQDRQRRIFTTVKGQRPFATVIACSDSRVPVEILFDQGIGDLFVIKVAGNVLDVDEVGSVEYGVDHLETPLMVVLGHTHCGAVTAVVQGAHVHGSIPQLVDNIIPAVKKARHDHPELKGEALVTAAVINNVWQGITDLLMNSPATCSRVQAGSLKVVGAIYDIDTGKVTWLGPHPNQAKILETGGPAVIAHDEESARSTEKMKKADHGIVAQEEHNAKKIEKKNAHEHKAEDSNTGLWLVFFLLIAVLGAVFIKTRRKKKTE